MYQLRDYQQDAVDATLKHFRKSSEPALIVLPTGAGKSLIIAELCRLARGHVVCLTHVKELVAQNHAKLAAIEVEAGIFSAGLNRKEQHARLTIASVQSLANQIEHWVQPLSLLIIDECHRIGPANQSQYQKVISHFRHLNPNLKVLGLTATPYRLDHGWIYRRHYWGFCREADQAFFEHCIYELPLRKLIKDGYLTPPCLFNAAIAHYDFSQLSNASRHSDVHTEAPEDWQPQALNNLVLKHPRVTQAICEQIISLSESRRGVMIFAATVEHATEISQYFPSDNTALILGETSQQERDRIILRFKNREIKFLINVAVLTTGFDAPHVDVIALLRPTQSVSLFQQIVGRGLRLSEGKKDCLVLDYTNSGFDLFQPEIGAQRPKNTQPVAVPCPMCDFQNTFWGRTDPDGQVIEHFGRRCQGLVETLDSEEQCSYRFVFKSCPHCQEENDIAARHCQHCQTRLIDPDETLKNALNLKDHKVIRCQALVAELSKTTLTLRYIDEDGNELSQKLELNRKKDLAILNGEFLKRLAQSTTPVAIKNAAELEPFLPYLPHPDFVIAKKEKLYFKVIERIFDYQGAYRKANSM